MNDASPRIELGESAAGHVARFGYRVLQTNAEDSTAREVRTARLLRRWWSLPLPPAVEVCWVNTGAAVEVHVGFRLAALDRHSMLAAVQDAVSPVEEVLRELRADWSIEALGDEEVRPAYASPRGDIRRSEILIGSDAGWVGVPCLARADGGSHASLIQHLAAAAPGTALVVAVEQADPHEAIVHAMRSDLAFLEAQEYAHVNLDKELANGTQLASTYHEYEHATKLMVARLGVVSRAYVLRASLVGLGAPSPLLVAAATAAFSVAEGGATWVACTDTKDLARARANSRNMQFDPWGPRADNSRTSVGAYAASLEEVLAWFQLPACGNVPALHMGTAYPAARRVPDLAARDGARLGMSVFDPRRPVALDEATRDRAVYTLGRTGTGKTTLLVNLAMDDIEAGHGVCFIDPHGDCSRELLALLPPRYRDLVVMVDPSSESTATLNALSVPAGEDADVIIDELADMFIRLWDPQRRGEIIGARWLRYWDAVARLLMAHPSPGSLADVDRVFYDEEFRLRFLDWVEDEETKRFWLNEFPNDPNAKEIIPWFTSKFRPFATNRLVVRVIGAPKPTLDAREIMDGGGILIARLPKGELGTLNSSVLGTLVMMRLQAAAFARASMPQSDRRPFSLFVDEAQNYATAGTDTLIAEGRKYGVRLTLANQNVDQLGDRLRRTILGNVGTLIAFRLGMDDAALLEREFLPYFDARDLSQLQVGRAVVRTLLTDGTTGVFDVQTRPPMDLPAISGPPIGPRTGDTEASDHGVSVIEDDTPTTAPIADPIQLALDSGLFARDDS